MERFYCNVHEGHISVYVRTKKHYNKILKALPQHVLLVQGPWNKKHKDLLLDPEQTIVVRKKPYWGKYDIRIEIQPRGSRYNRWSGHVKRRELMNDALLFIQDSIEEGAVRISNKRYWYGVIFYIYMFKSYSTSKFITFRFFRFACFIFLLEALLINTIIESSLIHRETSELHHIFLGFYERPVGFAGNGGMTLVFLICYLSSNYMYLL